MQVWITGYHGFLREAIGLFVSDSNEAISGNKLSFSELRL